MNNDSLLDSIRNALNQRAHDLDPRTEQDLLRARQAAMAKLEQRHSHHTLYWRPAFGFAMLCGVVFASFLWWKQPDSLPESLTTIEEKEQLTPEQQVDFYRDLEFYQWLVAHEQ